MPNISRKSPNKSRTRNKSAKIARIKETTRNLFEQKGYLDTTNHGIAKAAHVSVGLLYKYFPQGKLDILKALLEDEKTEFEEIQQNQLLLEHIKPENALDFLQNILKIVLTRHLNKKNYVRAMEVAQLSHPETFQRIRGHAQEIITVVPVIQRFDELKLLKKSLTRDLIIMNSNVIDHMIHHYVFFGSFTFQTDKEFLQYLLDLTIKVFEIKQEKIGYSM